MPDDTRAIQAIEFTRGGFVFNLHHPMFRDCVINLAAGSSFQTGTELVVKDRAFYKLLLEMLTHTSGANIAFHLPGSLGKDSHKEQLDFVEHMIEELLRILDEFKASTEGETGLVSDLIRRKLSEHKRLTS